MENDNTMAEIIRKLRQLKESFEELEVELKEHQERNTKNEK